MIVATGHRINALFASQREDVAGSALEDFN